MFLKRRRKKNQTDTQAAENMSASAECNICTFDHTKVSASSYSPAALAFLGDAVYSLLVREFLLKKSNRPARKLHNMSIRYVNAAAQAKAALVILPSLSDEEKSVYKRGRNAHSSHTPKNQSGQDYHSATGLEALFGYLYFKNDTKRIIELFNIIAGEFNE